MPGTFTHQFNTPSFKGSSVVHTGLFIDGEFVDPVEKATIDVVNPVNGKVLAAVSAGSAADVELAVKAAKKAYKTTWGLNTPGSERGRLLNKLSDLLEQNLEELAALEALNAGKTFTQAKNMDLAGTIATFRYYAGWADKIQGKTLEMNAGSLGYTRHEPFGVVGQIICWNFPLLMVAWKLGPALATGNTVVLKPSEVTPLTALRFASLVKEAGFPPGVINIINGYGHTVGQAISENMTIEKVAFTGSVTTGKRVMEAAARSNVKNVTLELGGKNPTIIFDDAELDKAVRWATHGAFVNVGQTCGAGSRLFVQEGIYDKFVQKFAEAAQSATLGDTFLEATTAGPQVSQTHFDRVMGYIESGKKAGAKLVAGGERFGLEGYFIKPTVFAECTHDMEIVREEIFGPVGAVVKFKDEAEVIEMANDTIYGLASAVFTQNVNQALRVAHAIEAGTVWINSSVNPNVAMPYGGYKQSGIGRELGEYALDCYTQVKAVHVQMV